MGKKELSYAERTYCCPSCRYSGPGYSVLTKSPPAFFLQPHPLYPMIREDFDYWVEVVRKNFPDHPMLEDLNKDWRPFEGKQRSRPMQWLRKHLGRV